MKLQDEYARIMGYTKLWIAKQGGIDKVKEYVEKVRKEGHYNNFEVRIANDIKFCEQWRDCSTWPRLFCF